MSARTKLVLPRPWTMAALALSFGYFLLLAHTEVGFPRDEGFYFSAAEQYSRWLDDLFEDPVKAFSREVIERRFSANPEHPALPKFLFGLSWRIFAKFEADSSANFWYDGGRPPKPILGLLDEASAMRLPAWLLASWLVFMVYRFGAYFFSPRAGFIASFAWAFMPHVFWHSHLACFDIPVTAMWFWTSYCYLRAEKGGGWKWAVLTGVAWGLALSTKHNAFFLPPLFLFHFLVTRLREFRLYRTADGRVSLQVPTIPASWLAMLVISPVIYYVLWPKLWFDPIGHLKWYITRHAEHEYYWAYYFGVLHTKPPFPLEFPFVMSAMTIPAPTILLFFAGLIILITNSLKKNAQFFGASSLADGHASHATVLIFVFLNFFLPFAVIAHPKVPIFGGTKHWIHGVTYLALFAGVGGDWVLREVAAMVSALRQGLWPRIVSAVAALILGSTLIFETLHGHTNGSTYYNAVFGGFAAMGDLKMQREFWGNTAFSALAYINENAPPGARVDFHDTAWDSVRMYRRVGLLRPDIVPVWDYKQADYFLFHWHKEFLDLEAEVKQDFGAKVPTYVVAQDGVPLLNVYRRKARK